MARDSTKQRTDAIVLVVALVLYAIGTNIGLGLAFKEANDRNTQLQNEIKAMQNDQERKGE